MNSTEMAGKWKELRGKARQQWAKLTDYDLDQINGRREELVGRLQQAYGKSREEIDREVDDFFRSLS